MQLEIITHRTCGECTACCTVLGVPELNKPPLTRCVHLAGQGCSIYDTRPASCRVFNCMWLTGEVQDESLRPDRCGFVISAQPHALSGSKKMTNIQEMSPGQLDSPLGRRVVAELSRRDVIAVVRYGRDPEITGPQFKVMTLLQKLAKLAERNGTSSDFQIRSM